MKRFFFALILTASPAFAGPGIADLAAKLASEDPKVRAAAREELLRNDEGISPALRAAAATATDAEARAALFEIAEILEEGRPMDFAREFAWKAAKNQLTMDEVRAWSVAPEMVFLCWLKRSEGISEQVKTAENPLQEQHPDPVELAKAGTLWLQAYTLADFGADVNAWTAFRAKTRGMSWREVRFEGLEQRGFRVRDADPDVVAAEFLMAGRTPEDGAPERNVRPLRPGAREIAVSFGQLIGMTFEGCPKMDPDNPEVDAALDWIEACGRTFWRKGNRIVSHAGQDDFAASALSDRGGVALAALERLEGWPDRVPADCWRWAKRNPELVTRVMAAAGHKVPKRDLPVVLEALGKSARQERLRAAWNKTDLAELACDRAAVSTVREGALEFLAWLDGEAGIAAARQGLEAYVADPRIEEHRVGRLAAITVADSGTPSDLDLAESWLKLAPLNYERIDVAIAIARRGRRAGYDLIVDRARRDLLDRPRYEKVREFVDGAPPSERDDTWPKWAEEEAPRYAWDAKAKKWKMTP